MRFFGCCFCSLCKFNFCQFLNFLSLIETLEIIIFIYSLSVNIFDLEFITVLFIQISKISCTNNHFFTIKFINLINQINPKIHKKNVNFIPTLSHPPNK